MSEADSKHQVDVTQQTKVKRKNHRQQPSDDEDEEEEESDKESENDENDNESDRDSLDNGAYSKTLFDTYFCEIGHC
jgi:hypothetical protein